jgi:hypothetical protein
MRRNNGLLLSLSLALALLVLSLSVSLSQKSSVSLMSLVGKHYLGDGWGQNNTLTLKADRTFSLIWDTDAGPPFLIAAGKYHVRHDLLYLDTLYARSERGVKWGKRHTLSIVRWGKRLYLVEVQNLLDFCNDINIGYEPRGDIHGSFYLKNIDPLPNVSGLPPLSAKWRSYLLKHPVTGKVLSIQCTGRHDERKGDIIAVRVNVGRQHGLKVGMRLRVPLTKTAAKDWWRSDSMLMIRKVQPRQSICEFVLYAGGMPFTRGAKVTTRADKS